MTMMTTNLIEKAIQARKLDFSNTTIMSRNEIVFWNLWPNPRQPVFATRMSLDQMRRMPMDQFLAHLSIIGQQQEKQ